MKFTYYKLLLFLGKSSLILGVSLGNNKNMVIKENEYSDVGIEKVIEEPENDEVTIPSGGGECLSVHNSLRALHQNTSDLAWSSSLASDAQTWANHLASLVASSGPTLYHDPSNTNQGENLYYSGKYPASSATSSCKDAIISWYSEIDYYNWTTHATNVPEKAIGHFTQVVWKNSANVGMAIATATKSDWIYTFIVARYTPAGNYIGQYGSNVKEVIAPGPCSSNPCQNGGTCNNFYYYYTCTCSSGYWGNNCQNSPPCLSNPCQNGGTCNNQGSSYTCACVFGYNGNNCQNALRCENSWAWCEQYKSTICGNPVYIDYQRKCLKTCAQHCQ